MQKKEKKNDCVRQNCPILGSPGTWPPRRGCVTNAQMRWVQLAQGLWGGNRKGMETELILSLAYFIAFSGKSHQTELGAQFHSPIPPLPPFPRSYLPSSTFASPCFPATGPNPATSLGLKGKSFLDQHSQGTFLLTDSDWGPGAFSALKGSPQSSQFSPGL